MRGRAEAGAGRLLPWVPVAFGTGIALYFTAAHDPVLSVAVATAVGLCVVAGLARRHKFFSIAIVIAAIASGFATATWRTAHLAHIVLPKPLYSVALSGFVETRDIREPTDRFVLHVTDMDAPRGRVKLERVRLSVRKGTAPDVGSFVELKARLQPPLAPLRPGSYDFARDLIILAQCVTDLGSSLLHRSCCMGQADLPMAEAVARLSKPRLFPVMLSGHATPDSEGAFFRRFVPVGRLVLVANGCLLPTGAQSLSYLYYDLGSVNYATGLS